MKRAMNPNRKMFITKRGEESISVLWNFSWPLAGDVTDGLKTTEKMPEKRDGC